VDLQEMAKRRIPPPLPPPLVISRGELKNVK